MMKQVSGKWLFGLLGLILALPLAAAPVGRLGVPEGPVSAGAIFAIGVFADGVETDQPVTGFGFTLSYDLTWDFLGAAMGPGFIDDSAAVPGGLVAGSVDPDAVFPSGDNIRLATLSFRPSIAGRFPFGVISDLSDLNQGLILIGGPTADLTTNTEVEVSAAPLPGSLALLMLGLAGLPLRHARRATPAPPVLAQSV